MDIPRPTNYNDFKECLFSFLTARKKIGTEENVDGDKVDLSQSLKPIEDINEISDGTLILKESPTFFLFSMPSYFSDEENKPDNQLEIKTLVTSESQTAKISEKSKGSETMDVVKLNAFVNASAWDLFDTYSFLGDVIGEKEFQILIDTTLKGKGVIDAAKLSTSESEWAKLPVDEQLNRIANLNNFKHNLLVTERLLASNNYQAKQSLLVHSSKGIYDVPEKSLFSYQIKIIWAYDRRYSEILAVTALAWNPKNTSLLAVGYGKLVFSQKAHGVVCIWSSKNPSKPERTYKFDCSVTCLAFSKTRANLLAAGFCDGEIFIIDISSENHFWSISRGSVPLHKGPIWKLFWGIVPKIHHSSSNEELFALGDAGKLMNFNYPDGNLSKVLISLDYPTEIPAGKKSCAISTMSGLSFSIPDDQNFCYISTSQGIILKCFLKMPCEVLYRLSAHLGPTYIIENSPHAPSIFLTCGADNKLLIWMDGILEPLIALQLSEQEAMVCAQWSPTIPTLIVTLSTFEIAIWDIAWKIKKPRSSIRTCGSDYSFTSFSFSPDGTKVIVGDQQGLVKVFQLSQLPHIPFLKKEALVAALKAAISKSPNLLHQVECIIKENSGLYITSL